MDTSAFVPAITSLTQFPSSPSIPQVERGVLNKGDDVEIIGFGRKMITTITGVEMFHKDLVRPLPARALPSYFSVSFD